MAIGLGVDFVGVNFYQPSPRCVAMDTAAAIARVVKGRARLVGVFVNPERAYVDERLKFVGLDLLQFHGDEEDEALEGWPVPVIRALRLHSDASLNPTHVDRIRADFILIDTFHPQLFGGTGRSRRLGALRAIDLSRVFISGGLTPRNAAEAAALGAYALDVASGVEAAPGIKDAEKLRSFVTAARASSN